ncbi:maleamate amidohydrolase [Rhizobium sp. PP-F2F-G20b]|nr:maleamate amidohydrolase [Rhizobium sp. PP-F2F-G20b]
MSADDLLDNYRKAYDNRIGFGRKPALVLVDFVQAYFEPDSPLYAGVDAALESALRIRERARSKGIPVILTGVVLHPSGADGGRFFQKAKPLACFTAGNPLGRWPNGLVPESDEFIVTKQYPSAFFGTSLAPLLTSLGVDNVVLTGLTTSGCVRASCVDAMSHGFITTVVRDACGDRHPAPHEANLFDMNAKYADVVSEADILAHFDGLS